MNNRKKNLLSFLLIPLIFLGACSRPEQKMPVAPAEPTATSNSTELEILKDASEIVEKRTRTTKTYKLPNGNHLLVANSVPVHRKMGNQWVEISKSEIGKSTNREYEEQEIDEVFAEGVYTSFSSYSYQCNFPSNPTFKFYNSEGQFVGEFADHSTAYANEIGRLKVAFALSSSLIGSTINAIELSVSKSPAYSGVTSSNQERAGTVEIRSYGNSDSPDIWTVVGNGGAYGSFTTDFGSVGFDRILPIPQSLLNGNGGLLNAVRTAAQNGTNLNLGLKASNETSGGALMKINYITLLVNYTPSPLGIPIPVTPEEGTSGSTTDGEIYFRWDWNDSRVQYCQLQLDDEPSFTTPLIAERSVEGGRTAISGLPPKTYYWRVRSANSTMLSDWTSTRSCFVAKYRVPVSGPTVLLYGSSATWQATAQLLDGETIIGGLTYRWERYDEGTAGFQVVGTSREYTGVQTATGFSGFSLRVFVTDKAGFKGQGQIRVDNAVD